LNWQTITKDSIYLSYYNKVTSEINIVYYKRTIGVSTFFCDSAVVKISPKMLKYHEAIITDNNILLTTELNDDLTIGKLNLYALYQDFML